MKLEGGCYCGEVRYVAEGEPALRAQCHCRECQYMTGGGPNFFLAMPADGFVYKKGEPRRFTRSDIENPVTREFCPTCGTHLATKITGRPIVIVKVGTLDDPAQFGEPQLAMFTIDRQAFHHIPDDLPAYERRRT
ncbi:GFA family protein [Phenylobacterium immobile]|uniref:GFA family protein n=1 Tax=Phenylobacterium immobile TaxID=21 RepID=UPI000A3F9ABE|nr:GFA family protein [Phenylobacterium immobile]